ncbi:MAG: esterase [Aquificota bacterium]|nr:MAG: esterase [Aquificota bacterium]
MKVIYIHGFNSAGYGDKVNYLKEEFGAGNVIAPTLPYDTKEAIYQLEFLVSNLKNQEPLLLVGTSLGGAYTIYLSYKYDVQGVVINPTIRPYEDLKTQIGKQVNYKTGEEYIFTEKHVNFLKNIQLPKEEIAKIKDRLYIYLDEEDELLDSRETKAFFESIGVYVKMYQGGDHRFRHMKELLEDLRKKKGVRYG